MSVWAYACKPCGDEPSGTIWYVTVSDCEKLPAAANVVRVKVGNEWRCALIDRTKRVEVEGLLVRSCAAAETGDCPQCDESSGA